MKRSFSAVAAAIPVVTAGLIGGISAPTHAAPVPAPCHHPWSDKDDGSGTTNTDVAKLRSGPNANCSVIYRIPGGTEVDYDCYTTNADGKKFTHVRYGEKKGWISERSLADGGSGERC